MDHIQNYFTRAKKTLIDTKIERDVLREMIYSVSGVSLESKDIVLKKHVAKLKIFGAKRTKILSVKETIIEKLKQDHAVIIVSLE